jgi:hypothetical protein
VIPTEYRKVLEEREERAPAAREPGPVEAPPAPAAALLPAE